MTKQSMREQIAAIQHEQWSGWMEYLFSKCLQSATGNTEDVVIPAEFAHRWGRQMQTPYDKLTDREQESDRKEADKLLSLFREKVEELKMQELRTPLMLNEGDQDTISGYNAARREQNYKINQLLKELEEKFYEPLAYIRKWITTTKKEIGKAEGYSPREKAIALDNVRQIEKHFEVAQLIFKDDLKPVLSSLSQETEEYKHICNSCGCGIKPPDALSKEVKETI